MQYDIEDLRKLALRMLPRAQKNLKMHGSLTPVGLAYDPKGFVHTFTLLWADLAEKRKAQKDFQIELLKLGAVAAVIISETWAKFADDGPLDLSDQSRSVRDMPGRRDAILVEAGSPLGRVVVVQSFTKIKAGKFSFDPPREFTTAMGELTSEFLDSVWPVYENHGRTLH
jgi:hypothetical protein